MVVEPKMSYAVAPVAAPQLSAICRVPAGMLATAVRPVGEGAAVVAETSLEARLINVGPLRVETASIA